MEAPRTKIIKLSSLFIAILFSFSCNNDTDLLADHILSDYHNISVVNDYFVITADRSAILDVLSNDGFTEEDIVKITEISSPNSGSVVLNEDMSITYTPAAATGVEEAQSVEQTQPEEETQTVEEETQTEEEETQAEEEETQTEEETETEDDTVVTDTFTYTTEVVNEDETVTTEEGTVEVVIEAEEEVAPTDEEEEPTSTDEEEEGENEAPKAVTSATPKAGTAPLEVQFKGSNSTDDDEIDSYLWDFKDGGSATSANPSHTFAEAGEYNVKLTVKDKDGLQHSKTITINVSAPAENEAPVAVASASPTTGEAPLEVQFKGSDSTDDDEIDTYVWDFTDGGSATSANPSHTFAEAGEYEVKLTVKDKDGLEHSKTVIINVSEATVQNQAPVAVVSAAPTTGVAPLAVQFNGSDSTDDNSISSYQWDFNDGSTATNASPSHTFNNPGEYLVKLTVQDENQLSHTKTITITVEEEQSNSSANLLFKSGFEGVSLGSRNSPLNGYQKINGTDSDSGFTWPPLILGSNQTGIHLVNDDGGAASNSQLKTVTGHNGSSTRVLSRVINYDANVTQLPYQINNITENPKSLYVSYWMKIDGNGLDKNYDWKVPWEYKTYGWDENNGYRIIAYFERDGVTGKLRSRLAGDAASNGHNWSISNESVVPPFNEWFKIEYYLEWGNGVTNGRVWWKINGQLVADHTGRMTYNNDNLGYLFVTQLYGGNSYPISSLVDDIEIWDDDPNGN